MKKVYAIDFIRYTDCLNDTVSNSDPDNTEYIEVGRHEPFLVVEDDIDHYMKFGGGIRNMKFVGYIDK